MNITVSFKNEEEKRILIEKCEKGFESSLKRCVEELVRDKALRFITLSGPTCSGKTTAAMIFTEEMEKHGIKTGVISIDDFYYDRETLHVDGKIDYDSVSTINLKLLGEIIRDIHLDKTVSIPIYSFKSGTVVGYREYKNPGVTMFEGIQAIYPEISGLFDKSETKSIYISVENDVEVNGKKIDSRTIRLFRRIVRDFSNRNAKPEFTLRLWESVAANENKSIIPYSSGCDFKINSFMEYEISLIKPYLLSLLAQIPENNEFYGYAEQLANIFDGVEPISEEYIPENSLYREFI